MANSTVTTSFGALEFSYSTREELEAILETVAAEVDFIETSVGTSSPKVDRIAKEGFTGAYRFVNGKVELLTEFPDNIKAVATTLYAYYPFMASAREIKETTGIDDFEAKVINQTNNRAYFRQDGGRYGLTDAGRKYVLENIKPKLGAK